MATCEVCGNEYDKSFELIAAGVRHTFDSFECAIQAIAPICEHCKCRVIGHGVEVGGPRSGPGYSVPVHRHLIGPIRPTRGHISTSPSRGLYQMPSLCIFA